MTDRALANGHVKLPHLGVIRVQGADAATFLQGQLTQDFALLKPDQARLAAWCSPKGRMLVSFWGWQAVAAEAQEPAFLLVLWRDRIEAMLKRLRMYVLRAKVTLTDMSEALVVTGLLGDAALAHFPEIDSSWRRLALPGGDVIGLPPAVMPDLPDAPRWARALWVGPAAQAPAGDTVSLSAWFDAEVWSGVAPVNTHTAEAFVPQMLNYESVGGVNFKKGCYPGQEVVARSQYRGTLKQRAYVAHAAGAVAIGDEIWTVGENASVVGSVALAPPDSAGGIEGCWCIVSVKLSALADGSELAVGRVDGPRLSRLSQPYALLDDI